MTKLKPKVTVILTSFNHEKYLKEAIDSVLQQTYSNFELIIWDDASTDTSWDIISQYSDIRIKAFRNDVQKRGVWGLNKAITEKALGEYIAIHHSDDVWEPNKLFKQVAILDDNSKIGAVFCDVHLISENGAPLLDENHFYSSIFNQPNRTRQEWLNHFFHKGNALCHPSVLIRKKCYERCGVYRYGFAQLPDFDMWVRLCLKFEIYIMPEKLISFRIRDNEDNSSGDKPETHIRAAFEFLHVIDSYRTIDNFEELVAVFPNLEKYYSTDYFDVDYLLGMNVIKGSPYKGLFGLNLLFDLLNEPERARKTKEIYDFDYLSLMKLSEKRDVFSIRLNQAIVKKDSQLSNLKHSVVIRDDEIETLSESVSERDDKIEILNELFLEREDKIETLSESVSERDDKIETLNETVSERDDKIEILNETVSKCNSKIDNLKQQVLQENALRLQVEQSKSWKITKPLRGLTTLLRKNSLLFKLLNIKRYHKRWHIKKIERVLRQSGLFDDKWYRSQYPDVDETGVNPINHYVMHGVKEGRNPNSLFNTIWYLKTYPDVYESGLNPLYHYYIYGVKEARNPNPIFDTASYLTKNPDVVEAGMNPLFHYMMYGVNEGRNHNSTLITASQTDQDSDTLMPETNPLDDYLQIDGKQDSNPDFQTIMLVAHVVSKNLFGGERSFLDMLEGIHNIGYNVVAVIPANNNQEYVELLRKSAQRIVEIPYGWWKKNVAVDDRMIAGFSRIITSNKIDVVHVNTIMLREPLIAARQLSIPSIVHVRELITHDQALCEIIGRSSEQIIEQVTKSADFIFANSFATAKCFPKQNATFVIPNTVEVNTFDIENKLNPNKINIAIISSNIPKKGIHDFIEVARVLQHELKNVNFMLIGPENEHIQALRLEQEDGNIPANIEFTGYFDDPIDALANTNIVLNLSHFQESFGRTVAEAMASRRPVVAYDWGALPELIKEGESGYLVPYRNIQAVADKLKKLCNDPSLILEMGQKGREIILERIDKANYSRRLSLSYSKVFNHNFNKDSFVTMPIQDDPINLDKNSIKVSVIVPNYNYSQFLKERLSSIINQTYKPVEIIFLDDASSDDSVDVAEELLNNSTVESSIVTNKTNKGVFRQWQTGIKKAKGDYVWIAEADDSASPYFLQELVGRIWQEKSVIAYCQSKVIDENGDLIRAANYHHTDDLSTSRWKSDYSEIGLREVVDYFSYRNTIPNASACLINKKELLECLAEVNGYKYCGDWPLYCALLDRGNVSYSRKPLNIFRRHSQSVTRSKNNNIDYLKELLNIKDFIANRFPICKKQIVRMKQFLDRDYQFDGLVKNSTSEISKQTFKTIALAAKKRGRFVFLTTNNGSYNGGSEVLWMESAIKLRELGHDVIVVIKKWYPFPEFFKEFSERGIKIYFKESLVFKMIIDFSPDLMVVSTGCQDEGTEWYEQCRENTIPYIIINQLTKEESFWPINKKKNHKVRKGYSLAKKVFFTCHNNHKIMESRLNSKIINYDIHFNPFHMDRNISIPFPSLVSGIKIAVPARLLKIHKAQDVIIKVLAKNKWLNRDVQVNFYGDGPDKDELVSLASELNVKKVSFIDRITDVSKIWEENHIILLASKMEGLPIVLVGAMMCARVPVVTDVGGHTELVDDNVNGFVTSESTVDALDAAMERAYARRDELEDIGKLAREKVLDYIPEDPVQNFSDKVISLALDESYEKLGMLNSKSS